MKVRRLKDTDVESLLSLWNRNMRYDQLTPELLEEKIWDDHNFSQDMTFAIEHEGMLVGFIMGLIRQTAPEATGYVKMLVIDAKYQRKGIGSRLLREMEKHICSHGIKTIRLFETAPNYLVPGLDVRYTRAMIFFEKNGYERFGETFNLEVDLSTDAFDTAAQEQELAAAGVEIRRALMADSDEISLFLQKHWPAWVEEVQASLLNYPISLHLACKNRQLIGFSAHNCNNKGTGWFGPMGTAPESRRLGIGGTLLRRCLRDIKEEGKRFATIPWVGPIGFYVHYAGAEISRVFHRYQKALQ